MRRTKAKARPEGPTVNSPDREVGVHDREHEFRRPEGPTHRSGEGPAGNRCRPFGPLFRFLSSLVPDLTVGAIYCRPFGPVLTAIAFVSCSAIHAADDPPPFAQVRAIFAAKCLACHGNDP